MLWMLLAATDCPPLDSAAGQRMKAAGEICDNWTAEARAKRAKAPVATPALQAKIKKAFEFELLDAPSARYYWPNVMKQEFYCGFFNAKNRMGAYSGWKRYVVTFENGKADKPIVFSSDDTIFTPTLTRACDDAGYPSEPG